MTTELKCGEKTLRRKAFGATDNNLVRHDLTKRRYDLRLLFEFGSHQ
jgi:hypothetical protein